MKMNMKNITKFLSIILISVFVMSLSTNVFAGAFLNASEFDNIDKATNVTNMVTNAAETTVSVLRIAGVTIAVVMLLAVAMKYMMSSAGDRADIKKHAVIYVVGAVVMFASTGILGIIQKFATGIK